MERNSIYEVAKKAGVSIATVSRVLNHSPGVRAGTKAKVEQAFAELHYTPNAIARSLVTHSTDTVGILATDVRDSYYANAIFCIEQFCHELGVHIIQCNTGGTLSKKEEYIRLLLGKQVDALVFIGSVLRDETANSAIYEAARRVPVIMFNSILQGENIYSVRCDEEAAVEGLFGRLKETGRRSPIFVYDAESYSGKSKRRGFEAGLARLGLPAENRIFFTQKGADGGAEAFECALHSGLSFDSVICAEDLLAAGVIKAASKRSLPIPDAFSLFGFNNSYLSLCTSPELSTVDGRVEDMAKHTVRIIKLLSEGGEPPGQKLFTALPVFRKSG